MSVWEAAGKGRGGTAVNDRVGKGSMAIDIGGLTVISVTVIGTNVSSRAARLAFSVLHQLLRTHQDPQRYYDLAVKEHPA